MKCLGDSESSKQQSRIKIGKDLVGNQTGKKIPPFIHSKFQVSTVVETNDQQSNSGGKQNKTKQVLPTFWTYLWTSVMQRKPIRRQKVSREDLLWKLSLLRGVQDLTGTHCTLTPTHTQGRWERLPLKKPRGSWGGANCKGLRGSNEQISQMS